MAIINVMSPSLIAKEINKNLILWLEEKEKLVVAIDGWTGVGKTTILKELEKLNQNIVCINQDDFILSTEEIQNLLKQEKDHSIVFELKNINLKAIKDPINQFRSGKGIFSIKTFNFKTGEVDVEKSFDLNKKILVMEGVFMFHPDLLNNIWDKRIYIDGNISVIDKRRVEREKERWGENYFPEDHPDSFFKQVIIALKRYTEKYKPQEQADVVLNIC